MALPTLEKTWQFNVNQAVAGGSWSGSVQEALYLLKQSLITFPLKPWVVWGSCDGAGNYGNNDGIDRWASRANCVWGNTGQQPEAGSLAIVFECWWGNFTGSVDMLRVYLLPTGVATNGSATTIPTAADAIAFVNYTWGVPGSGGGTWVGKLHAMQSTDGLCTRVVLCYSGNVRFAVVLDKPKNPISTWSSQFVCGWYPYSTTATPTYAQMCAASSQCFGYVNSQAVNFCCTSEGWGTAATGQTQTYPDDDTAEYPMSPMHLVSDTLGGRGLKGQLYDIWWGSTAVPTGGTYPGDGSNQFATFGNIILPWNGTAPVLS
jgi:hypothetical protein